MLEQMDKNTEYTQLLQRLLQEYNNENRFLEFKSNYQDINALGKYISALSNGACLENKDYGYLFFGVDDITHEIRNTSFDIANTKAVGNENAELYLRRMITPKIDFRVEDFIYADKYRVVVFIIPAAYGEPTTYMQKPYIRLNSHTTELTPYTDWLRNIYNSRADWTKEIVPEASIDDIDPVALQMAKEGYKSRYPKFAKEVDSWSNITFLDKAKLTINGKITRATLLLIGKEESAHYLNHIAQIVWRLQTDEETAGDIYTVPFLLSANSILQRIRNYRIKIYPRNSLIPAEVWKYDTESILEALYNCIAHQDYTRNGRIVVTEHKDELVFTNQGTFFEGSYEDYYEGTRTPDKYRNPFLVQAMVNLKMIDTQGYGIHKIFLSQRNRYLPMPEYDKSDNDKVILHLPGAVINTDYSVLLFENADINLTEAFLLDRVQRHEHISDAGLELLRRKKLVEGRKNTLYISSSIAKITKQKAQYSKNKGLDDEFYRSLILKAIKDNGTMGRQEINELLWNKLPEILNDKQKFYKITNLLTQLRQNGRIELGTGKEWQLTSSSFKPGEN